MIANIRGIQINYSQQPDFWKQVESGKWEPFTFDCIDKYCTPGSVFIDIGAWNGVFSVYANKLGCVVYSVEPDEAAIKLFEQLVWINQGTRTPKNICLCTHAISDCIGEALITSDVLGNSESSLIHEGKNAQRVKTTTLGMFCESLPDTPTISLIKMDIEGAEISVLSQAKDWIMQHKPNVHISFHPAYIEIYEGVMYLFDIYNAVSDGGTVTTAENFRDVLDSHQHAFMFTKK